MPCFHPLQAWRTTDGSVVLSKEPRDGQFLRLPCGNCLGCRTMRAQAWTLRCHLEMQQHQTAVFATLTYDDEHKPLTLDKSHVSAYIKKLRKTMPDRIRFFASGEYGERTERPHYHAIIFGAGQHHLSQLEKSWPRGHVKIDPATPARIAYTAGYCSKKIGYRRAVHERVVESTGEVYTWQPPFILMSRNPGIGAHAKQFLNSWRLYAIKDDHKMPVPRYYKDEYKLHATKEDLEQLRAEIDALNIRPQTREQLDAAEAYAIARQKLAAEKRNL